MFPFIALTYIHRWQGKKPHVFNLYLHLKLKKCHIPGSAQTDTGAGGWCRLVEISREDVRAGKSTDCT
jgi:hypothetical protein